MIHPQYTTIKIEATLELCTVNKGIPYGLAVINYEHPDNKVLSFKGVGIFKDGILHQTPFTCIRGNGERRQYACMIDGRPQNNGMAAFFSQDGYSQYVTSTTKQ